MIPLLDEGFDALERGDLERFMAIVEENSHPDCEFTSAIGSEIEGRTYVGPEGMRTWFGDVLDTVGLTYNDREFRVVSDNILVFLTQQEMRGRGSGAVVSHEIGVVYEHEDGLFRRGWSFFSHAEALAAAEALHA